jgi:hypothetical protein
MPGFVSSVSNNNEAVFAHNADFSGSSEPSEVNGLATDGQLWVGSTATNAGGTHVNVGSLTSPNGTLTVGYSSPNITLDLPAGSAQIFTVSGSLTNSQIKNLHGTPIQIIPAPGANKTIAVLNSFATMIYGGNNVFTAAAGQNISVFYGTTNSICTVMLSTAIVAAASSSNSSSTTNQVNKPIATVQNTAVNLYNTSATEISGNAANDNVINYAVTYQILNL